jgi:hypothetical protein
MKKSLLVLSVFAILFSSCKKDDVALTPTKENLTGTYIMTAFTIGQNGVTVNAFNNSDENLNWYEACDRDDQYQLNADMTYHTIDAGTECFPDNNYQATWRLVNTTTLELDGSVITIKSFDGAKLVLEESSTSYVYTYTYVKQ